MGESSAGVPSGSGGPEQAADARGPSRRSILRGLAVAAGSLALDPFRHVRTDGRRYQNLRLGIAATLPSGWVFGSVADFASLREQTTLLDELEDELHALKDPDNLPIFVFERPTDREDGSSAGVVLYDEPLEGPAPSDELAGHVLMLEGFAVSYRDFDVALAPRTIALEGAAATVSTWSYTHELDTGAAVPLSGRSILVFRGDRVHTFHLTDSLTSPVVSPSVWEEFAASLRYARRPALAQAARRGLRHPRA